MFPILGICVVWYIPLIEVGAIRFQEENLYHYSS